MTRLTPYASQTVAYLWRGNWYTVDQMKAIQGDTRNLRTAHDAQCNALPYTAAMLERRKERLQDMTNRKELEPLTDCKPLTVAIVGSRDYADLQAVADYVNTLPSHAVVVSGGARGVDSVAAQTARARGLQVVEYLADWNQYGKSAGFRRNADIVNAADKVVAFWDGTSKGTAHSIGLARQAGKPVEIIERRKSA